MSVHVPIFAMFIIAFLIGIGFLAKYLVGAGINWDNPVSSFLEIFRDFVTVTFRLRRKAYDGDGLSVLKNF